jgi:hypothetical protein
LYPEQEKVLSETLKELLCLILRKVIGLTEPDIKF